uniref:Ig-like domain-containing protein n=1 Tax=Rhabditophanes sp. KR3021 TaxID=114890 RepID=A0AC35UC53_9BILA
MTELTVSLAGDKDDEDYLKLRLFDPKGQLVEKSQYSNESGTIDLKNVKLNKITDPMPGMWMIETDSRLKHTLRVFGHGDIDFKYGFASRPVNKIELTHPRPVSGQQTHLYVNMSGLVHPGSLKEISLYDYYGNEMQRFTPISINGQPTLYSTGPFHPPKDLWFVKIEGKDKFDYPFVRIAATAISTVEAGGPRALMAERTTAYNGEVAKLVCIVESDLPYTVQFKKNGEIVGGPLYYKNSDTITWEIPDIIPKHRGYYECLVTSSDNRAHSAQTFLETKEPAPKIINIQNATVILKSHGYIPCTTASNNEKPLVQWFRGGRLLTHSHKHYTYPNGTLRILDANKMDAGDYLCRVSSTGGETTATMNLAVYERPKANMQPKQLHVAKGGHFLIQCHVYGVPLPKAVFFFKGAEIRGASFKHKIDYKNQLEVSDVTEADIGAYECRAISPAGTSSDHTNVELAIPPKVRIRQPKLMISRKDTLSLECETIQGSPTPHISFFKDGRPLTQYRYMKIINGRLLIQNAADSDAGNYTCRATNIAGSDDAMSVVHVGSAATIVPGPEKVMITIEKTGILHCRALGHPPPKVTWYKNEVSLDRLSPEDKKRFTLLNDNALQIDNVSIDDQSNFVCRAVNVFGATERKVEVFVTGLEPPVLSQIPPEENLIENVDLRLHCQVFRGTPKPTLTWYKDSEKVDESESIEIEGNGASLLLRSGFQEDAGLYTCKASSAAGSASVSVNVISIVKPIIEHSYKQENETTKEGDDAEIPCKVNMSPVPNIKWYLNDKPINMNMPEYEQKEDFSLVIKGTTSLMSGNYTCVVSNIAGKSSKSTVLTVHSPPSIAPSLESFSLREGDSATLPCESTGNPPPVVKWYLNDVEYMDGIIKSNGNLVISKVDGNLSGWIFKCVATNQIGSVSKDMILNVHVAPTIDSSITTRNFTVNINENIRFFCAAKSSPPPKRDWKFEGNTIYEGITNGATVSFEQDGTLSIEKVQIGNSGFYECKVSNFAGQDNIIYHLDVQEPPRIISHFQDQIQILKGTAYELPCRTLGIPQPIVLWQKDGIEISNNQNLLLQSDGSLKIFDIDFDDQGRYSCTASNNAGRVTRDTKMIVISPPFIDKNVPNSLEAIAGNEFEIKCPIVSGVPTPDVTFFFKAIEITDQLDERFMVNGDTLLIDNVMPEDRGPFTCKASNVAGKDEITIELGVITIPELQPSSPENENPTAVVGSSLVIECPVYGNVPEIKWFFEDTEIAMEFNDNFYTTDENRKLHVVKTVVDNSGAYKCVITNVAGSAEKHFNVEVLVPPKMDEDLTKSNLKIMEKERIEIGCPVDGIPKPVVSSWLVNGQILKRGDNNRGVELSEDEQKLVIKSVELYNEGSFVCVTANKGGSLDIEVNLDVLYLPKLGDDELIEIEKGKTHTLRCINESDSVGVKIDWTFNDKKTIPSNVNLALESKRIFINGADKELNNVITCIGTNEAGSSRKKFTIDVLEPPEILGQMNEETIELINNESVILECDTIGGNPVPEIAWLRDNEPIGNADRLLEITEKDAGNYRYTCLAKNKIGTVSKDTFVKVFSKPVMNLVNENDNFKLVTEGVSVTFNCPVTMDHLESMEIEWLRNGVPITGDMNDFQMSQDKVSLTVRKAHKAHDSVVRCNVKNKAGAASQDFRLKVLIPPSVVGDLVEDISLIEGQEKDLQCIFDGTNPIIDWIKDDEPFTDSDKIQNDGSLLLLKDIKPKDGGTVRCRGSNDAGTVEKTFNIKVISKPKMYDNEQPVEVDVLKGENKILTCPVTTTADIELIWYKNDEPIINDVDGFHISADRRTLQIIKADKRIDGTFKCTAKNSAGSITKPFDVRMTEGPRIYSNGGLINVVENNSQVLHCEASGSPPVSIQWTMNALPVDDIPGIQILSDGQRLKIVNADYSHLGTYACNVRNKVGAATISYDLDVITRPKLLSSDTHTIEIIQNQQAYFVCPVSTTEKMDKNTVSWMKDNVPIEIDHDEKFTLSSNNLKLNLYNATIHDEGIFSCQISNSAGTSRADFNLVVLIPPTITMSDRDKNRTVVENSPVTLTCSAQGHPEVQIKWYKDNELITNENCTHKISSGRIENQELIIDHIHLVNEGRITCEASNQLGSVEQDIFITVLTPPKIIREGIESEIDGELQKRASIYCPVVGKPYPKIVWLKDSRPLEPSPNMYVSGNGQKIHFTSIDVNDESKYTCIAKNSVGEEKRDFTLRLLEKPTIEGPNILSKIYVNEGKTVVLDCPARGRPIPDITWLKNGEHINLEKKNYLIFDNGRQLQIANSSFTDDARYTCIASNIVSTADLEMILTVVLPPKLLSDQSKEYEVIENESQELFCNVSGSDPIDIIWLKDGRMIEVSGSSESKSSYLQITNKGTKLHFLNVQKSDKAIYECDASNAAGQTNQQFNLTVLIKPTFDERASSPPIQTVIPGNKIRIDCKINALPKQQILWLKENEELVSDGERVKISGDGQTLLVDLANDGDEGKYTCKMSNKAGHVAKEFLISLTGPPTFEVQKVNVSVEVGAMQILTCVAEGTGLIFYNWTINDEQVQEGVFSPSVTIKGNKVEIKNARRSDASRYTCTAENESGSAKKVFNLNVLEAPRFIDPRNIQDKIILGKAIKIDCSVSGEPKPTIQWKKVFHFAKL